MKHQWKQRFSVVLSAAVMLSAGNVTTLYGAENDVVKKIAGFDELDEGIAVQILEIGADESDIRFPASLWVDWVLEEDETADDNDEDTGEDRATKSNADKRVHKRKKIQGIEWVLSEDESTEQEFDPYTEGTYVYEPVLPSGYVVDDEAAMPQIVVEMEAAEGGTGLSEDGVLTLTETKGSGTGWSWNGQKLDVNADFKNGKKIVFEDGIVPTIMLNRGEMILAPENEEDPVIETSGDLKIDSARTGAGDGKLTLKGTVDAGNITISGYAKVTIDGSEGFSLEPEEILTLEGENAVLTGTNGGSIYLREGSAVEGVSGIFDDQGKVLAADGSVPVVGMDEDAAEDQLTEGSYVYANGKFTKKGAEAEETVTGLKDGILTITKEHRGVKEEGWNWNGTKLDINGRFSGNKQIVFEEGMNPVIQVNSGLTIKAEEGTSSIIATGDLTIKHGSETATILTVEGSIEAKNTTISCNIEAAGNEVFRLEPGEILKLDGGSISGGSIYLSKGSIVEGMGGLLSDQGQVFDTDAEVTVAGEDENPADGQLTAGNYVYGADGKYTKNGTGGGEAEEPEEPEEPVTGLKDGILTITKEHGGVKEEGWSWNGWRLDINDKFDGNKQIVFADGVMPTIKVNREVTITPDPGQPGIIAAGDLTMTASNVKLTVNGPVEADSVTIQDSISVDAQGIKANNDISISDNASVISKADGPEAALCANNGAITISGKATVIASNQSGAAMNQAPDTSSYPELRMVVSKDASGKPAETYSADKIAEYRYLKVERLLSKEEIEESVENLTEDSAPELVDALADQIRSLPLESQKNLKWEIIEKVDDLLQKAINMKVISSIEAPAAIENTGQIQNAKISGALLAAGIRLTDAENTQVVFHVTQREPEKNAVLTFDCELTVNEKKTELAVPVEVTIELPPEFYPLAGLKIHHVGDGIDEWMDFVYNGADNTTTFRTDSFSTFSVVKTSSSSGGGSSSGSSGSGGSSGGGTMKRTSGSASGSVSGKWIQDEAGWWYQNPDKSYPKDGWANIECNGKEEWYFFDKNGYMMTGWVFWNGNWYYLSTASDGTGGVMLTGWQTMEGKRYYFSEAIDGSIGVMLRNIQVQEYYLDQDGVAQ